MPDFIPSSTAGGASSAGGSSGGVSAAGCVHAANEVIISKASNNEINFVIFMLPSI